MVILIGLQNNRCDKVAEQNGRFVKKGSDVCRYKWLSCGMRSSDKEGIMKKIILIASALFLTGGCALASNGFGDGSPENGKQHSHYILSTHRQINLKNKANFYRGDGSVEGLPYRDVI